LVGAAKTRGDDSRASGADWGRMEDAQIYEAEASVFASPIDTGGYWGLLDYVFSLFLPKTDIRGGISSLLELL
jgi:hypothetical protein